MSTFHAVCYGLGIEADVPIPGLAAAGRLPRPDVRLHVGRLPVGFEVRRGTARPWRNGASLTAGRVPVLVVSTLPDRGDFLFAYADGTEFVVTADGSDIWARWPPASSLEDMTTYLLGPVLGFVLRRRGIVCLHASVVLLRIGAVGFVGPGGSGKSTLAAMFARLGRPVVSEDVAALVEVDGTCLVEPGYPRLRLWPDSVRALFGNADALPALTPTWDKRYLDLDAGDAAGTGARHPLAALYVLGRRQPDLRSPTFAAASGPGALLTLVANGYVTNLVDAAARGREFEFLSRLVETVPLRHVTLPDAVSRLEAACEALEADADTLARGGSVPA